ncbi:LPXTG cell wall anchor domain-containing protein [Actinoplanes sp. CA-030573]|uniref:LPXTG cell wall anchor domain-containing protein n=1 Tax=Actinoplanes sp. CA-030573 TaxID=3239898 RepID=UPI003D920BC9
MRYSVRWRFVVGIAAALALATGVTTPARAADISVRMAMPDVLVGAGASADVRPIVFADQGQTLIFTTMTYELSDGLEGVRLAGPADNFDCTSSGPTKVSCPIVSEIYVSPAGNREHHAVISADPGANGETGKITMTFSGGGVKPASLTVDVSVVHGVDLAAGGSQTISVAPGATFGASLEVRNNGDSVVHGAAVTIDTAYAFSARTRFANCLYRDDQPHACVFDQGLEPGVTYQVTLPYRLRRDTYAPSTVAGDFVWRTADGYRNLIKFIEDNGFEGPGTPGTGAKLELKRKVSLAKQTDTDPGNNSQSLTVNVTGRQGADLAAVGVTASAAAGATITLPVGVRNNGPATLDPPVGSPVFIVVTFPAGTEVVTTPAGCMEQTPPPHADYACYTSESGPFRAKTTVTWKFRVKVTKVVVNATGTVAVDDVHDFSKDINEANNVAKIVLNPAKAGNSGGGQSEGEGGGSGGGLPITGPPTSLIGAAGAGLVAIGLAGFLIARRRRTRFEA